MTNVHNATAITKRSETPIARTLEQEADELEALRTGLVRHLEAWRGAHETAILRLADVVARMDAMLTRLERSDA